MGTGRGLGCLGREGEGGVFDWRVDGKLDQFGVVMGNWTSSLEDNWQLGQFGGKCEKKLDQCRVR